MTQQGVSSDFGSSQKRKRASSEFTALSSSRPSHLPRDTINPFSYTPSTLAQLSLAGLTDTDEDPTRSIPDFPHRGFNSGLPAHNVGADTDGEMDAEDKKKPQKDETGVSGHESHFDVLMQTIHRFLDQGDVSKAARAYGLILQLRPKGLPVDIRHHRLWAIGAEILMREGELPPLVNDTVFHQRWGSAANMGKVKAYYETLIQQHPYDYKRPNAVSAFDFWLALLNCEVYNVHAEHTIAISRLDEGEIPTVPDDEHDEYMDPEEGHSEQAYDAPETHSLSERELRVAKSKNRLRLQALAAMKDITTRMDSLMQEQPYAKNSDFLRLRAMCSLYVADLVVPAMGASPLAVEQTDGIRDREQHAARLALQKMVENGGELDHVTRAVLGLDGEEEDDTELTDQHSSLPIRGV